jgi:hypothetical protein
MPVCAVAQEGSGLALPVKALKVGQEDYWLDQIAKDREEYFSGKGESPGRFIGEVADASGLQGEASAEQVRAMFRGLDPATGGQRCKPLWRADPRSKLSAAPLLAALKERAAAQGAAQLEALATSKALTGDVRSVQAACKPGASGRVKVETVERLCRKVLGGGPHTLYGDGFDRAWQHRGRRVDGRVAAFDHCFSSPKSVSLLAAGGGERVRREVAAGRAEALEVAVGYLQRHGIGVRRDHNGTDRYPASGGLLGVAFEHRMSRAGDPNAHTHVLVQNTARDKHRYGVEPICRVLAIAPSTYYHARRRPASARALRDTELKRASLVPVTGASDAQQPIGLHGLTL